MNISDVVEKLKKMPDQECWLEVIKQEEEWLEQYLQSQYLNTDNLSREQKERYFFALIKSNNQCSGFFSDSAVECTDRCKDVESCKTTRTEILSKDPFSRKKESMVRKPVEKAEETKIISMEEPTKPLVKPKKRVVEKPAVSKESVKKEAKPAKDKPTKNLSKQKKYNLIIQEGFQKFNGKVVEADVLRKEMEKMFVEKFGDKDVPAFNYTYVRKPDVISDFCLGLTKKVGIKYSLVGNKIKIESVS